MKHSSVVLTVLFILVAFVTAAHAADVKDKIKVDVESVGLHPGMDPGMYVCALGHLHIKGTVYNGAGVPVGHVKVAGKAYDADGKLLGTATTSTKATTLKA